MSEARCVALERAHGAPVVPRKRPFGNRSASLLIATAVWGASSAVLFAQATGGDKPFFVGHDSAVNNATFTSDGRFMASVSADQTLRFWNPATGEELRRVAAHQGQAICVVASPDGRFVFTGGQDNLIKMWDVPRAEPLFTMAGHEGAAGDVAVSPNGQWAASVGADAKVRLWNMTTGELLFEMEGHQAAVTRAAVRADSAVLATADAAGFVRTWNPADGAVQGTIGAHARGVTGLVFHVNNQQIITTGEDGLASVWQLPAPTSLPRPLVGHDAATAVQRTAITSDNQFVVTGGADRTVRVFSLANGQPIRELPQSPGPVSSLAINANNQIVAAGSGGAIKFWNLTDGADRGAILAHDGDVTGAAFHPDGQRFVSVGDDGTLRLWRLPAPAVPLAGHTAPVLDATISPNGQLIATASADKSVRLWNGTNGQAIRQLDGHLAPVRSTAFRSDSAELATGDASGIVRIWNPNDGAVAATLGAHTSPVTSIAYHPSADPAQMRLATSGKDGWVKLWKLPVVGPKTLAAANDAVTSVVVSSDGKWCVAGSTDQTLRVFDTSTGNAVGTLPGQTGAVTASALSADNKLFAAANDAGQIRIWTLGENGMTAADAMPSLLAGHVGPIRDLSFWPDGSSIVSAGEDGTVRVWRLPSAPQVFGAAGESSSPIVAAAVSADGKLTASGGASAGKPAIFVRDTADGRLVATLLGHDAEITSVAFSADGKKLASGSADKTARVWDLADAKFPEVARLEGHAAAVTSVAFDAQAAVLFTGGADNAIKQFTIADGAEVRTIAGHGAAVSALLVRGGALISGSADATVRQWNVADGAAIRSINHGAAVTSVGASADGAVIASAGADNSVKVWNGADGAAKGTLAGHTTPVTHVAVRADGLRVVSVAADGVRTWEAAGRPLEQIPAAEPALRAAGFSGDGTTTIAVAADNSTRLIAARLAQLIVGHEGAVAGVAVSADGKSIVSAGADKTVRVWNAADGAAVRNLAGLADAATSVAISPDGSQVAAASLDKNIRFWNLADGALAGSLEQAAAVRSLHYSGDGARLATCAEDGVVRLWDVATKQELERFTGHEGAVLAIGVSADGQLIATGGADKSTRLWSASVAGLVPADKTTTASLVWSNDGTKLYSVGGDPVVKIWDAAGKPLGELPGGKAAFNDATVRTDGLRLAATDVEGRAYEWSLESGELLRMIELPQAMANDGAAVAAANAAANAPADAAANPEVDGVPVAALQARVAFAPDGSQIAVATADGFIRLYAEEDGRLLEAFNNPAAPPAAADAMPMPVATSAIAFSPDGTTLLAAPFDNQPRLLKPELERLIVVHEGAATGLAITPDGQSAVTCGADKTVKLWSLADGKPIRQYIGAAGELLRLTVSKDGARVIAASASDPVAAEPAANANVNDAAADGAAEKGRVYVWPFAAPPAAEGAAVNPAADVPLATSIPLPAAPSGIATSGDNARLAIGAEDGEVRVWDFSVGAVVERFAASAGKLDDVAFAADNKSLAAVGDEGIATVLTMSLLRAWRAADGPVTQFAYFPNGSQAATAGANLEVKLWTVDNGLLVRSFAEPAPANQVADGGAENNAVQAPANNAAAAPAAVEEAKADGPAIVALAVRADGQQLAAATTDQRLLLWNLGNGQLTTQFRTNATFTSLRYSVDNLKLLAAAEDGRLRVFNPTNGTLLYELKPSMSADAADNGATAGAGAALAAGENAGAEKAASVSPFRVAAFAPDNRRIVAGGTDGQVGVWTYASPEPVRQFAGHGAPVHDIVITSDGDRLASCSADQTVRLWNVETGAPLASMPGHVGPVYGLALSPDNSLLVSTGADSTVRLWDVNGARQLKQLSAGDQPNYTVAFHPDGKRVAAAGQDHKIRVLDVLTGAEQAVIEGHPDFVHRLHFNKAGNRLLSCGYGRTLFVRCFPQTQPIVDLRLPEVANAAIYSGDESQVLVSGGAGQLYLVTLPAAAK